MDLPRRSRSLLLRLLVAYLLPTLALIGVFGWLVHRVAASALEGSLGRRLVGIAQAAAVQLRPSSLGFLSPGDDASRTARRLRHKLTLLERRTRVARLMVLDRELRSKVDTRGALRIGEHYYHADADRSELGRVFSGEEASSVLFVGADGRTYKTGYAPVLDDSGQVVAAVAVEGSAEFFTVLDSLRTWILISAGIVALLVTVISVLVARRVTHPLRSLAREAERIGAGDLERPIAVRSDDEVGTLASTMNEMRQGLFERDQQMQMMLSGIAHEVRNPLGGIELFAGILRDELADRPEMMQHVGRIERELAHLKKVVGDFLDYARRSDGTAGPVDLSALAREIVELMSKDAAEREVELTLGERHGSDVVARGDPDQLRRVLINLVRNGLQATPAGGRVELSCAREGDRATVRVEDTGSGFDGETAQRIFTPFFTTREKGTGLGLAFVKKIVDEHKGRLTVHSEPGAGASFTIALPRHGGQAGGASAGLP